MKKKFFLLCCLIPFLSFGQIDRQAYLDQRLQDFLALEGNEDLENWMEWLDQILQNPWDINQVTAQQLRIFPLLSEKQIEAFLQHRQAIGAFQHILEIQSIEGWDEETWRRVAPLFIVQQSKSIQEVWWKRSTERYVIQRWDRSIPKVRGLESGKYMGNGWRFQQRFRMQRPQDYSLGLVLEKDPGERSYTDYVGFHLSKQRSTGWIQWVVGDYQIQFGQGLVWGAGHFVGKGGETVYSVRRGQAGLRPYTSISERQAMRGVAGTFQKKNWYVTGLFSWRKGDARSVGDTVFTSLSTIGYHRTETEIQNKNSISMVSVGGDIHHSSPRWLWGTSWGWHYYSLRADPSQQLYNLFAFREKQIWNHSLYYSYQGVGFQSFGEWAYSPTGMAWVQGATTIPHPKWEMAVLFRRYGRAFHTVYGQAFGEFSQPNNEQGLYVGLKFLPKKGTQWTLFYDQFSHSWIRFQTTGPGSGEQMGMRFQTTRPNKSQWIFQAGWKNRQPFPSILTSNPTTNRWQWTGQWISRTHSSWNFHSRFLYNAQAKNRGWGLFQDIKRDYSTGELKLRVGYFRTDGYGNRLYVFEPDVLMGSSFPSFFGEGIRWVGVWKQAIARSLDVWCRLAYLRVWDRPQIGSGEEITPGPEKWTGTLQIRYQF
ncbi:MAG: ComEA family DNA-binding protein [Spirosomataceae bacterium]